jgi:hypothetical protein
MYAFLTIPMHATLPAHPILLHVLNITIVKEEKKLRYTPCYAETFSSANSSQASQASLCHGAKASFVLSATGTITVWYILISTFS